MAESACAWWRGLVLSIAILASSVLGVVAPNAPLERPYTLRTFHPYTLERQYTDLIAGGGRLGFIFPAPCPEGADSGRPGYPGPCREAYPSGYRLRHALPGQWIGVSPILGAEYRLERSEGAVALEGGAISAGAHGPASYYLDARLFAEEVGPWGALGYDREGMDSQDKSATGSVSYDSYARYRGNLNLDLAFGRLTAARDAGHWGPALFHNLVFHQEAVPFHHLVFTTVLGPLRVASLYGSLAIAPRYIDSLNLVDRNVYAHRYELSLGRDILLGISEQMILYDTNVPFLFAPIFPLFIAKGFMYEHSNNSNLAFDAAWRLPGGVLAYGEFLLDDLESPASLFTKDYVQNKWALTLGVHAAREVAGVPVGAVLEWSRVEPWVYAHFEPNTAQAAHLGHPLGNPAGPNSASLTSRFYARSDRWGRVALQFAWLWKGEDAGSGINDDAPGYQLTPKKWLKDVDGPTFSFSPTYSYEWRTLSVYLAAELGSDSQAAAGLRARY